jgi:hypothetical protein
MSGAQEPDFARIRAVLAAGSYNPIGFARTFSW